jgi:hypothetical protein
MLSLYALVAGVSLRNPGFDLIPVRVAFLALGYVFSGAFGLHSLYHSISIPFSFFYLLLALYIASK